MVARRQRDPVDERAVEIRATRREAQSDECAGGARIPHRRALAREIRKREHASRACVHRVRVFDGAQLGPEPVQREARGRRPATQEQACTEVARQLQPGALDRLLDGAADHERGSEQDAGDARLAYTRGSDVGVRVVRPGDHRRSGGQAERAGGARAEAAGLREWLERLWQRESDSSAGCT